MKTILAILLLLAAATALETITEDQLQQELTANRQLWLVHRSASESSVVGRVGSILKGFFRVVSVSGDQETLSLYGDDREAPIVFDGEFDADKIVGWALKQLDEVIASRSEDAKSLKAFQEYQEREKERANKEWRDE